MTPVTFQNIVPGLHRVRVSKNQYFPWEKILEIRAEQVTFANRIWLWKQSSPSLVLAGSFFRATADPLNQRLALLSETTSTPALAFWSPTAGLLPSAPLTRAKSQALTLRWRNDGAAVLINGQSPTDPAWWSRPDEIKSFADVLPPGSYHWSGDLLLGFDAKNSYRVDTKTKLLTKTLLATSVLATSQNLTLKSTTSSRLLVDRSFRTRLLSLPEGAWMFAELKNPFVLLRDRLHWLALDPSSEPLSEQVTGDYPRWFGEREASALFLANDREVWLWRLGSDPTLLWRQSDPIKQVAWHRSGTAIFIADTKHVFALELDDRNGRTTTSLATMDRVDDISVVNRALYIVGQQGKERGLWKLDIE